MPPRRRLFLTAALAALAGCSLPGWDSEGNGPTPTDVPSPPSGVERLEEYFNESGELVAPVDNNRVSSERLSGSYDRLVNSAGELERLGEAATEGETVRVARPVTPYRTAEWIKINVDNFILSFESRWAENGEPIVKPADGADVGGIHIAESQPVRNVLIERLGFDGNEATMDDQVSDLDAVRCDDPASRGIRIRDLYARRTHPYHEHSTGGSGISLDAERFVVEDVVCEAIGDRAVELSGGPGRVSGVTNVDGFDRTVSFDAGAGCANVTVSGVIAIGTAEGSAVGINEPQPGEVTENITVSDVVATDVSNSAVVVGDGARNISVSNVVATRCGEGIVTVDGVAESVQASGLKGLSNGRGCSVTANAKNISFSDILITDPAANTGNGLFVRAESPRSIVFSNAQVEANSYHAVNIRAPGVELNNITTTDTSSLGMTLAGDNIVVRGYSDREPSRNRRLRVESTASDCRIQIDTDVFFIDRGTRTRINGQLEVSEPPTTVNYGPSDAGLRIIDTSTNPVEVYYVLRDGELARARSG